MTCPAPIPKQGDLLCDEFKAWIRSLVCFQCGARDGIAAHHVIHRSAGYTDDATTIPACPSCHERCHGKRVDGMPPITKDEQHDALAEYQARFLLEAPLSAVRAFIAAREVREVNRIW